MASTHESKKIIDCTVLLGIVLGVIVGVVTVKWMDGLPRARADGDDEAEKKARLPSVRPARIPARPPSIRPHFSQGFHPPCAGLPCGVYYRRHSIYSRIE